MWYPVSLDSTNANGQMFIHNIQKQIKEKKGGFSLAELSIVLIIIGLLVAGVSSGSKLVEQTKLRSLTNQINQIQVAAKTYKLTYGQLPGDHDNATAFWSTASDCHADNRGSTDTCNGNGSKFLTYPHGSDTSTTVLHEAWHFWKHLSNSKIWPGDFSGQGTDDIDCTYGHGKMCIDVGISSPKGPFKGSGWIVWSMDTSVSTIQLQGRIVSQNTNRIVLGNPSLPSVASDGGAWWGTALTTTQQYNIDKKLDDGLPYQGKIVDMSGSGTRFSPNCATANSDEFGTVPPGTTTINASYDLTYKDPACVLIVDLE